MFPNSVRRASKRVKAFLDGPHRRAFRRESPPIHIEISDARWSRPVDRRELMDVCKSVWITQNAKVRRLFPQPDGLVWFHWLLHTSVELLGETLFAALIYRSRNVIVLFELHGERICVFGSPYPFSLVCTASGAMVSSLRFATRFWFIMSSINFHMHFSRW